MKNNCLALMASNVSGKLQSQILTAIDSFVKNGIDEITANMVRDRCFSINPNIHWSGRIPAICNGMRNSLACGAVIISEDRDFGDFTILFGDGDIINIPKPLIRASKESNKIQSISKESKMTQAEFIDTLVDSLHVFSPEGRKRIYKDLTHANTQLLCKGQLNGQPSKGVSAFGKPNRILIEKRISEKYINFTFIDNGIKWELTSGVKFELSETRKSVKLIVSYLSELSKSNNYKAFIITLLKQLKGNNLSLIRLLSQPKYKSKTPGSRLVGKQTQSSRNKNLGFVLEHTIPADFFSNKLLEIIDFNSVEIELELVMSKLFSVWLNTDDDILLKKSGLNSKMPPNWTWENDPLERYWLAGIKKDSLEKLG